MFMTVIDLETADLSTARTFYTQTLGLPLQQATTDAFTVQARPRSPFALPASNRCSITSPSRSRSISGSRPKHG